MSPLAIPGHPSIASESGGPSLALHENVIVRLYLAASAPQALARRPSKGSHHHLMKEGADSRVSGEKLVIATGQRLPNPSERPPSEAGSGGGPVPALWPDVLRYPLVHGPRAGLRSHPCEMGEAGLPPNPFWYPMLALTPGCLLGELVGHLVSHDPAVRQDPSDGDAVASGHHSRADLDGRPGPLLARAHRVRPDTLNRRLGVCEIVRGLPVPCLDSKTLSAW